jgi:hypothetical protein
MNNTIKMRGAIRPVNPTLLRPAESLAVRDVPVVDYVPVVGEPPRAYGPGVPEADRHARRLADQADAWIALVRARGGLSERELTRKAVESALFTERHGARSLAIPSKLAGTKRHQPALWALVQARPRFGHPLEIAEADGGALVVSHGGETLGMVQSKHVPWARPLIPFGLACYLARVTGHERASYTLGCNVVFGHVGAAVLALAHALGAALGGDGHPGDDRPRDGRTVRVFPAPALPGGDGAAGGPPYRDLLAAALPGRPAEGPADVVLWRDERGAARASVHHDVRHSPTGIGFSVSSGGADLARSILLAFADEETAERLSNRFLHEVIARIPYEGCVMPAAFVSQWIADQGA